MAIHIAQYAKMGAKCEKRKVYRGCSAFHTLFFRVLRPFFCFFAFRTRVDIHAKSQRISWFIFFRGINKIQNSYEMLKVYSECFVFCGVFRKNTLKMRKVYSRPYKQEDQIQCTLSHDNPRKQLTSPAWWTALILEFSQYIFFPQTTVLIDFLSG